MATILVTGFEPFGGKRTNSSWEAVKTLPATIDGHDVVTAQLPVTYRVGEVLEDLLDQHRPAAVVSFGLRGSHPNVQMEQQAWNYGGGAADNVGAHGPLTLSHDGAAPIRVTPTISIETARKLLSNGQTIDVSDNAGTFICEALLYNLGVKFGPSPFAFFHMPAHSESAEFAGYKTLPLATLSSIALNIVKSVVATHLGDASSRPSPAAFPVPKHSRSRIVDLPELETPTREASDRANKLAVRDSQGRLLSQNYQSSDAVLELEHELPHTLASLWAARQVANDSIEAAASQDNTGGKVVRRQDDGHIISANYSSSQQVLDTLKSQPKAMASLWAAQQIANDAMKGKADGESSYNKTGGTVARRWTDGTLQVADPIGAAHAATKGYVDGRTPQVQVVSALPSSPTAGVVYLVTG